MEIKIKIKRSMWSKRRNRVVVSFQIRDNYQQGRELDTAAFTVILSPPVRIGSLVLGFITRVLQWYRSIERQT